MRNQEEKLLDLMRKDEDYNKVLQTISDFGMALTVKFKRATQPQWFRQAKVELFVSVSRHVNPNKNCGKRIITCCHIFFSNSKFKNGDEIAHYHELMLERLRKEFEVNFTHFIDWSDSPSSEFRNGRLLKQHCQTKSVRHQMFVDKAYYAEYHARGIQDQTIATVKYHIECQINKNAIIKSPIEYAKNLAEKMDMHPKGVTVDRRFVYCVDVSEIKRLSRSDFKTAVKSTKTYFAQSQSAGSYTVIERGRTKDKRSRNGKSLYF